MTTETGDITLPEHEKQSQWRYEELKKGIDSMSNIDDKVNIHLSGGGQDNTAAILAAMSNRGGGVEALAPMLAAGGGFGGQNGIWPIVLLALLGRNGGGLFGGNDGAGVSGLNNLQGAIDTNAILSNLGDIKASVPLSACQTQNAVENSASATQQQLLTQSMQLMQQAAMGQLANVQGFANTGDKIDSLSTAQAVGFGNSNTLVERTGWQLSQAISNDGEKTRALIQSIDKTNDSRLITAQANEIVELRNERSRQDDRRGIEIQISNVQQQAQLQAQQQQQLVSSLFPLVNEALQVARATNSNVIVGNTGAVGTSQTANPTNVRA